MAAPGASHRSSAPASTTCRRWVLRQRLMALSARPDEVTLTGTSSITIRDRAIPLVPVTVRDAVDSRLTHEQLTMMINYRAPALVKGNRPYPSYEARYLFESEQQLLGGEKPTVDPMIFKDKVVFLGLTISGLVDVFQSPFGSQGTMPGIQLHASIADSILSNRFIRQASDRSRILTTLGGAVLVGLMAALLPFLGAARGHTAGGVGIHPLLGQGLRQWLVAQHGTTARRHDGGALCRYRLPVLRRGGGKTCRQEALRPIRFERCLPAAPLQSGAGRARRKAP